jgi:uncharacterized protein (TIGR03435 family)
VEFEAASVKPHLSSGAADERAGIEEDTALIKIENLPLRQLIGMAWRVKTFQILGPAWLSADTFDIVAKPPTGYQRATAGFVAGTVDRSVQTGRAS